MIPLGRYEISLIIIAAIFLGLYLNGLFRLYWTMRQARATKPFSRAAGA
jgi:hypothetical protein